MTENIARISLSGMLCIEGFIWDGAENTVTFDKVGLDYSAPKNKAD